MGELRTYGSNPYKTGSCADRYPNWLGIKSREKRTDLGLKH